jgi:hypothetical protein
MGAIGFEIETENINVKGSGIVPGPFACSTEKRGTMMKAKALRMVEGRFTFQASPPGDDEDVVQFDVRMFLRNGKLRISIHLHGQGDVLEDLDPTALGAMGTAIETVKGKVKAGELYEQTE